MNNDLISRSELKKALCEFMKNNIGIYSNEMFHLVDSIPAVEQPQGEWIMQRHDIDGCFYTCSNCGRMIRVPLFIDDPEDNETLADYPFCHCGAKMKGGAE